MKNWFRKLNQKYNCSMTRSALYGLPVLDHLTCCREGECKVCDEVRDKRKESK